jgi:outer membrane protein OmpA-like peptidoglycan-associated protein
MVEYYTQNKKLINDGGKQSKSAMLEKGQRPVLKGHNRGIGEEKFGKIRQNQYFCARMKKLLFFCVYSLFLFTSEAQVAVFGNVFLNGERLADSKIIVKIKGAVLQTYTTGPVSTFSFEVDFGPNYEIYIENAKTYPMFFEVITEKVPMRLYDSQMAHYMDASLNAINDERIDTNNLKKPFYRIVYDGKKKMVEDEPYTIEFEKGVYKKLTHLLMSGKVYLDTLSGITIKNKAISAYDKNGKKISSTFTNRYGAFLFLNIIPSDVVRLEMDVDDPAYNGSRVSVFNDNKVMITETTIENGKANWLIDKNLSKQLNDTTFTSIVGGKLISASAKEKKFFANKNVYLITTTNKILSFTKSNTLGSFVFENIKPNHSYYISVDKKELKSGERIDMLTKDDNYIATLDSSIEDKMAVKFSSNYNKVYNDLSIEEKEIKMEVQATIFGDNVNHPIGKLKVLLLNDMYQVIDSSYTDNLGTFKFKYLPFLKRFYLSAENTDNILDVFQNILIYSNDANLIKIMTHQKGTKFLYNAVSSEMSRLRDIELEDPWLEFVTKNETMKAGEAKKQASDNGKKPAETGIKKTGNENKKSEHALGKKEDKKPEKGDEKTKPVVGGNTAVQPSNIGEALVTESAPKIKSITEQIHFEKNKANLTPESKEILDKIILVMDVNKNLKIEICGHTDSQGTSEFNMALSSLRAFTVKNYIAAAGIKSKRMSTKGFGETQLLNNCADGSSCSEAEHALNRRIEFKILSE